MCANLKNWREAASLILAAKQTFPISKNVNYKLLTMKRSAKMNFMPDAYVFPGGSLVHSDTTTDWWKLFERFGFNEKSFDVFNHPAKYKPEILKDQNDEGLPRAISLRICAIRETFEETGILICRNAKIHSNNIDFKWATCIDGEEIQQWQKLVHNDSNKFLELCMNLEMYPNVWALHEWSNWLTPTVVSLRFDTIFFLTTFQNVPNTHPEENEVQDIQWLTAQEYLEMNQNNKIPLPPPQFYEFSRLLNFNKIEDLSTFSQTRSLCGTVCTLPHIILTDKQRCFVLPGDNLYPKENKDQELGTISEKKIMHRIYSRKYFQNQIVLENFTPELNHLLPITNFKVKL